MSSTSGDTKPDANTSDARPQPAVGVVYEPDESPDGFPLEFGNIIIGLPKQPDQPNTSTTAEELTEDDPAKSNSTGSNLTESNLTEGDSAEGDSESDATEPDATEGDATEGDATEGDATEGDATEGASADGASAEGGSDETVASSNDEPATPADEHSSAADQQPPSTAATSLTTDGAKSSPADETAHDETAHDDEQASDGGADGSDAGESSGEAKDASRAGEASDGEQSADGDDEGSGGEQVSGEKAVDGGEGGSSAEDASSEQSADGDGEGSGVAQVSGERSVDGDGESSGAAQASSEQAAGDGEEGSSAEDASSGQAADGDDSAGRVAGASVGESAGEPTDTAAADTATGDSPTAEDATAEDVTAEDAAADDTNADDTNADDTNADDANADDTNADGSAAVGESAEGSVDGAAEVPVDGAAGAAGGSAADGDGDDVAEGAAGADAAGAVGDVSGAAAVGDGSGAAVAEAGAGHVGGESGDGGELTAEGLAERLAAEQAAMALITALMKLRGVLAGSQLPLEVVGADEARQQQKAMLDQLDDYLLPRLVQLEAPILAVVGGSTGAGKSTLVNTVIGKVVSEPGVLRPTTRSPVLIHHPADADWFVGDRVLPGMARTAAEEPGGMEDAGQLRLVEAESVPRGLAILDAPDIDSVVQANRDLATQLLAAADLWLFVTTAARYSDAVPWEFLQSASDRSTAVAVVLDRAPSETIDDITGHLAQMLLERGLGDSPLFSIQETVVDGNGMLPQPAVASIKDWLIDLAADAEARAAVVRRTLQGAVSAMVKKAPPFAAAVKAQADTAIELRSSVESAYDQSVKDIAKACQDGTLLRGEVLARWQEFVGTGELLKGLQSGSGRLRDRLKSSLGNKPAETRDVSDAIHSGLESLLSEHAAAAAERAEKAWQSSAPGRQLLAAADAEAAGAGKSGTVGNGVKSNGAASTAAAGNGAKNSTVGSGATGSGVKNNGAKGNGAAGNGAKGNGGAGNGAKGNDVAPVLGAMSEEFPEAASRVVREWQAFVLDLIRTEGAEKKSTAKILEYGVNGLGLSLMVVLFASAAGIPKGAEASAGAGSAVVGQRLLEAVFGDKAVQSMVAKAREDLDGKVHALMDAEFARYLAVLDQHPVDAETARQLTEAARAVEDCT
ncbi:AAA family ATPase [Kribbella sp. NPDC048928]|uniref:AAA family ATPase n=1 Tax=Kribbella sp. NPDC048928 TaxID=3364111 RepID=UPI003710BDB8